ncbi:hypothetical protein K469DRAFT_783874, partial [Zopfia rhizophila CBS 207.26]
MLVVSLLSSLPFVIVMRELHSLVCSEFSTGTARAHTHFGGIRRALSSYMRHQLCRVILQCQPTPKTRLISTRSASPSQITVHAYMNWMANRKAPMDKGA